MGWTINDIPCQEGRLALVTGANIGLGLETTRSLAQKGATVIMACRNRKKGEAARRQLLTEGLSGLDLLELDLADLDSVGRAAASLNEQYGHLNLLVNNAGIMAPPRQLSAQGYELQFAVNHLGHMALTQRLLPLMASQADARVVTVTSGAQYFGRIRWDDLNWTKRYDRYGAYGQSKLANVMFALELQSRLQSKNSSVQSFAAHPGIARTNLQPAALASGGNHWEALVYRLMDPLFQSSSMGVLPQLYAATAPNAQGGEHYGPAQLGGLRGSPTQCRIAPAALDPQQRQRLWILSEKLINTHT
ncbi:oxidoreductase [Synechococcus sp. M16CYN]|uniref:oxidoreductase n=1 Tax=Synechococcus sp. M16CYN TaxID=3103139 RepID=UPI00324FDAB4